MSSNDFILGSSYDQYPAAHASASWPTTPTPSGQYVTGPLPVAHPGHAPGHMSQNNLHVGMMGHQHAPRHTPTGGMPAISHNHMHTNWNQPQIDDAPTQPHLSALSPDHLNNFDARNQLDFSSGDLPAPPDDANNPFAIAPPETVSSVTGRNSAVRPPQPQEDSFALAAITTGIVAILLVSGLYLVFISLGAAVELIIHGPIRLIVTVIASIIIPMVPLVAEGGRRERFQIQHRMMRRARRAMSVGVAGAITSFLLLCLATPEQIVSELRSNPNWFTSTRNPAHENPIERTNRMVSYKIADLIERSTLSIGMYDSISSDTKVKPDRPAPTRPAKSTTDTPNTTTTPPRRRRSTPAPTRPRPSRDATKLLKEKKAKDAAKSKSGGTRKKKKQDSDKGGTYEKW